MSRIGKKIIALPDKVTVAVAGGEIKVSGPKGNLSRALPRDIEIVQEGKTLAVKTTHEGRRGGALHGLNRTLIANMITGVSAGFTKGLEISGALRYDKYTKSGEFSNTSLPALPASVELRAYSRPPAPAPLSLIQPSTLAARLPFGRTRVGALSGDSSQLGDPFLGQEGEELEVIDPIAVIRVEPELVEAVGRGALGREPDRAEEVQRVEHVHGSVQPEGRGFRRDCLCRNRLTRTRPGATPS